MDKVEANIGTDLPRKAVILDQGIEKHPGIERIIDAPQHQVDSVTSRRDIYIVSLNGRRETEIRTRVKSYASSPACPISVVVASFIELQRRGEHTRTVMVIGDVIERVAVLSEGNASPGERGKITSENFVRLFSVELKLRAVAEFHIKTRIDSAGVEIIFRGKIVIDGYAGPDLANIQEMLGMEHP